MAQWRTRELRAARTTERSLRRCSRCAARGLRNHPIDRHITVLEGDLQSGSHHLLEHHNTLCVRLRGAALVSPNDSQPLKLTNDDIFDSVPSKNLPLHLNIIRAVEIANVVLTLGQAI